MFKNKRQLILLSVPLIGIIIVLEIIFIGQDLAESEPKLKKPIPSKKVIVSEIQSLPKKQALEPEILYSDTFSQEKYEPVSTPVAPDANTPPADMSNNVQSSSNDQTYPSMGDDVQQSNYNSEEEREPNSQEVIYTQPPPEVLRAREEDAQMTDEERRERKNKERIEAAIRIHGGLEQRIIAMKKNIQLAEEQGSGVAIELEEAKKLLERTIEFSKKFEDKMKELKISIPPSEVPTDTVDSGIIGDTPIVPASEGDPKEIPMTEGTP